ncbi:GTPase Era [Andreesenia angusta]|uniref:GTPase Era n=1 Tax=Andreesenia angusta TaxID=39480 RepID=A0A1S1VAH4_9FIRM|nr:GTP-binding protein [Andreesenia angusta]OHW63514.1 GTPase Era [Andreesenia angusta]
MNRETVGNRLSVGIYGKRSSGKSRLMNNIIGQDISVVSKVKGTTTDPVSKSFELGNLGTVVLTDTAGIDDSGVVGVQRVQKTLGTLAYMDLAIYVMDSEDIDEKQYLELTEKLESYSIPHILVFNKADKVNPDTLETYKKRYQEAAFMSAKNMDDIDMLKLLMEKELSKAVKAENMLEGLANSGDRICLLSSREALETGDRDSLYIQILKEALAGGVALSFSGISTFEKEIEDSELLVIEDSEIEKVDIDVLGKRAIAVSAINSKGNGSLRYFLDSIDKLEGIDHESKFLFCSSEEDLDREKVKLLYGKIERYTGVSLDWNLSAGDKSSSDIQGHDFIVEFDHGSDMRSSLRKLKQAEELKIPMASAELLSLFMDGKLEKLIGKNKKTFLETV